MLSAVHQIFGMVLIVALASASRFFDKPRYGLLRQANTTDVTYTDVQPCEVGGPITICISCQKYKVCTGQPEDDTDSMEPCPDATPYCEAATGSCSASPDNSVVQCSSDTSNNTTTSSFKCTGEGKFPDPLSCAKFYYCAASGVDGVSNDCPPNYSYNVTSQECQLAAGGCQVVDCSSQYVLVEYPTDPQYFYYCKTSSAQSEVFLFSCGSGSKFDVCSEQCVFECTTEGLFAKASNPNSYYQCYSEDGTLKYIERSCPVGGQVFDETLQFCIFQ
ncbi:uncharacterized protein LOC134222572 [Armigeres subalbatus]|uniref:uncharacterized protein LOC134222572 n=1 Tax=Armigeres subalbatus TaxID=124917 RepID=UPI002ED531E7